MRKLNQKGFSAVEGLLSLIVVLLIVFVGYYIYHAQKNANNTLSSASKVAQSSPGSVKKLTQSSKTTSSQKYITIKEWGIKIPYGTNYNFSYSLLDSNDAGVTTDTLAAADANCTAANSAVGLIQRAGANDPIADDGTTAAQAAAQGQPNAHIGSYYYFYSSPQAACSENSTASNLQIAAQAELKALVPLAEANN
jgi:Tfp pilus assembly protein PilV